MSVSVTFNGVTYTIPATGDVNWGAQVTAWIQAVSSGALTKSGGSFVLTAELDLGPTYGLKSIYVKSRTANPAQTGAVRLAYVDALKFRNSANSADLALTATAVDSIPAFNSIDLVNVSTAQTLTNKTLDTATNVITGLTNANLAAGAAVALSKLAALTTAKLLVSDGSGIISASTVTATEAGFLSGVTSAIQTQINTNSSNIASNTSAIALKADAATVTSALALKAPLASPTFTGTVTVPAPSNGTDAVTKTYADTKADASATTSALALKAPLASPTFTGTVTVPTPSNATDAVTKSYVDTADALKAPLANPVFTGTGAITLPVGTTAQRPGTPTTGMTRYNSDTVAPEVYNGTTWGAVGGGSSGINYITNYDGTSLSGWNLYNDGAVAAPIDGTGGTATGLLFYLSSLSPLRGTSSFILEKDAVNRQGTGVSYDFVPDLADRSKPVTISFDYFVASGTYNDADVTVWVLDVLNNQMIQPTPYTVSKITTNGTWKGEFQLSSNSASYRLILHVAGTSTSAFALKLDNFSVGPGVKVSGAVITDPVAYTPTFTGFGTVTAVEMYSWRDGAFLVVDGNITCGTVTASLASMTLGFNGINGNVTSAAIPSLRASGAYFIAGAAASHGGNLLVSPSSGTVNFGQQGVFGANSTDAMVAQNGNVVGNTGGKLSITNLRIPILGWSSNVQMSSDAETRVVAATASHSAAAIGASSPFTATTIYKDTHGALAATGRYTAPLPGFYTAEWATNGGAANMLVDVYVDGSLFGFIGGTNAGGYGGGSATVYLRAGQIIDIRPRTASTYSTNISFRMASGPAQIAASESVSASYYSSVNTSMSTTTPLNADVKIWDSHGAVTTGSGWKFTAPISGTYSVSVFLNNSSGPASAGNVQIYKNGALYKTIGKFQTTGGDQPNGTGNVKLLAGEYLDVRTSAAYPAYGNTLTNASNIDVTRVGNY